MTTNMMEMLCRFIVFSILCFIRLRQNTLQLAAGMNGRANAPKLEQRRRVGFGEFSFDTPQQAAGRFIFLAVIICPMRQC